MERSRNPYDLEQRGQRLRLVSLITGLTIEVDIRNRQERKAAANLMEAHHAALCGVQDACGLRTNATVEARKRQYDGWHYMNHNPDSQHGTLIAEDHESERTNHDRRSLHFCNQ